jgi:hypothetical protein
MADQTSSTGVAAPPASAGYAPQFLQRLIDQTCCFNVFAVPSSSGQAGASCRASGAGSNITGVIATEVLHRYEMGLNISSSRSGVYAANAVGEVAGRLELHWVIIPHEYRARPDREPPQVKLDPSSSQRLVLKEMTMIFGDGCDGFRSFGTGRTFPVISGGRPKIVVSAVGDITEGFGNFRGHDGNYTLCGELLPDKGFLGHIVVRIADPQGTLRSPMAYAPVEPVADPDPEGAYLLWTAQKGAGSDQENTASLDANGQLRGLNIPTQLKRCTLDFTTGPGGFRSMEYQAGEVIGREVGFGRGSYADAPPTGTPLSPYLFEGVAKYSFFNPGGSIAGAITTNVVEGRRFDLLLSQAPGEVAWRFGFFGPIVLGAGCFQGVQGMFYGVSTSVFKPPPGRHVITHLYAARLIDPEGRYRAAIGRSL